MTNICNLCCFDALEPAYGQAGLAGPRIYVCAHCGFTQTLGDIAKQKPGPGNNALPLAAAGGKYENKHAGIAVQLMRSYYDFNLPLNVLDVGAAQGAFVRQFLRAAPRAAITAIEPDAHRAWACKNLSRSNVIEKPVEKVSLPDAAFEIVHCRHALEYLDAPLAIVGGVWNSLKTNGLLMVTCRNIGAIRDEAIVEEWFAPHRRNFFSPNTLIRLLSAAGFEIMDTSLDCGRNNIVAVAKKSAAPMASITADPMEVHSARMLISLYKSSRQRNLAALRAITAELNALSLHRMAILGSGHLFDSLVRHAGLDKRLFLHLPDKQLGGESFRLAGAEQSDEEKLRAANPRIIVMMSDGHADRIAAIAARCTPNTRIIHYSELVFRAFERLAA